MADETLADLMRSVGIEPSAATVASTPARPPLRNQFGARRPMPRQMRPPEARANDTRLAPSERTRAYSEVQRTLTPPMGEAYTPPRNQFAEAGQAVWEMTPVPHAGRLRQSIDEGDWRGALEHGGMTALNTVGLLGMLPRGSPPAVRPPMRNVTPRAVEPTPPPRPTTDAVQPNEFDIGPLYRGHDGDPSTGHWRASEGMNGEGVYLTHDEAQADKWALRQAENDPTVHTLRARGPIADNIADNLTFEEAREQGFRGLRYRSVDGYDETVIFDPRDVSPSMSRRPARPTPSDATRGGAENAYLAQLRADGFNVDEPLYRGMTRGLEGDDFRPTVTKGYEDQGPGVSVSRRLREAEVYAGAAPGPATEGATIYPVFGRGKYVDDAQYYAAIEELVAGGATYPDAARQVQLRLMGEGYTANASPRGEVRFWPDESGSVPNVRSRFGRPAQSDGGSPRPPPDLNKSHRRPKPPSGGFLLPRRN